MEVIPVVNCGNEACVRKMLAVAAPLGAPWVEFDVSDGTLAPTVTWNEPAKLAAFMEEAGMEDAVVEAHLMTREPARHLKNWLLAGAKRAIVHIEALPDDVELRAFYELQSACVAHDAELGIALAPVTPIDAVVPYLGHVLFIQLLAVTPGPAGQAFNEATLAKLEFLRGRAPEATIEIDGGVTPAVARKVGERGADIIAVSSYIFGSKDPAVAYRELIGIS